eukprot:358257-Prorocentrum_minimum.AAC.4
MKRNVFLGNYQGVPFKFERCCYPKVSNSRGTRSHFKGASATEVPTSVGATPDAPRFYQYFEQYVVWRSHSSGL